MVMPTAARPSPAYRTATIDPTDSARTTEAPPWSSPYGCVLPSTGMVATTRSIVASVKVMPILAANGPPIALSSSTLIHGVRVSVSAMRATVPRRPTPTSRGSDGLLVGPERLGGQPGHDDCKDEQRTAPGCAAAP